MALLASNAWLRVSVVSADCRLMRREASSVFLFRQLSIDLTAVDKRQFLAGRHQIARFDQHAFDFVESSVLMLTSCQGSTEP